MNDIDKIIVAALTGDASEDEIRKLSAWRAASPENDRSYQTQFEAWTALGSFDIAGKESTVPRAEAICRLADERERAAAAEAVPNSRLRPRPVSTKRGNWLRRGLAASIVLAVGLGMYFRQAENAEVFGPNELVTGPSEVATTTLQDGTIVRLAPDSRLEFSAEAGTRSVYLQGRAYFAVSHQPERPFRVNSAGGIVEVLGTRFDVQSSGGDLRITVVEGEVRVATPQGGVDLHANQRAESSESGGLNVETIDDVYESIGWLGPFLAFEQTPLGEVAEEMHDRFGIAIEIRDPSLRQRTVSGWFRDESPHEIMSGICRVVEARCFSRDGLFVMEIPAAEAER